MNEREKLRSESLNLLRFPLAVVVLTNHVFGHKGEKIPFDAVFEEINHFVDAFLRGQSVPIYFFISGYVFFLGITLTKDVYQRKLRNRINTLLIPYLIWNVLDIVGQIIYQTFVFERFSAGVPKEINFTFLGLLNCFWDANNGLLIPAETLKSNAIYPQDGPLWFLRDLMIVAVSTPIIYWLLKHIRHYLICLLGLTWFILGYWDLGHSNQLLTAFFFFSWGAYMSVNKKDMLIEFGKFSRLSAFLYIALGFACVAAGHWLPDAASTIKRLNIIVGLFFAYNLASWLLQQKICRPNAFLASASFFIYISHALVIQLLLKLSLVVIQPTSTIGLLVTFTVNLLACIGLQLSAFWLLRRYTPGLLKLLTGRK